MSITHFTPPYAIARFDGALMFGDVQSGLMTTGAVQSPIVTFRVLAGAQIHPVWALDALAVKVYSYAYAARALKLGETQLQVSVTASWVSTCDYSNLIATQIEWHAPSNVRSFVERMIAEAKSGKFSADWPSTEMRIPSQKANV